MTPQDFSQHVATLFVKPADRMGRLLHAGVGASTETGELLDALKKHWIYQSTLDLENVIEECGDILFYTQAMLNEIGITMEQAMQANYEKLKKRYPAGYTDQAARERADKAA